MKKIISLVLVILTLFSVMSIGVSAASYVTEDIFTYNNTGSGFEITGIRYDCTVTSGTTYKIPDTHNDLPVIGIAASALRDTNISAIILSNNTTYISDKAFAACENLRRVYMPKTLTFISDSAFNSCPNFKFVYYQGTKDMWNNLISTHHPYGTLKNVTAYCNYPTYCYHISTQYHSQKNPTCSTPGLTQGRTCNDCGDIVDGLEPIPATGKHTEARRVLVHNTCTEGGSYEIYCTGDPNCTYSVIGYTQATGHDIPSRSQKCSNCDYQCKCHCHKLDFIAKIMVFFYKLFKVKKYCECGDMKHW